MYLTFTFGISDAKNDDGQGRKRRLNQNKSFKKRQTSNRLSNRKKTILFETASAFSSAYQRIVSWGMKNWDQLPFTFSLADKDGNPVLDKEGKQKFGLTSAHYLANWLSARVVISDLNLHSRLMNGVRNQAAETLLSQYQLREMEQNQPRRLTGQVGEVKTVVFDRRQIHEDFDRAVKELADPKTETERIEELKRVLSAGVEPKFIPVLFPGPADFLLFKHSRTGKIFVCLPLLSRDNERVVRQISPSDQLISLRPGEDATVPNSGQWVVLPLDHQRSLANQRNAEEMISNPEIRPRTGELRFKNGSWHFNIVVDVPEPEPIRPESYLGIHIGFYSIFLALTDKDGRVFKESMIDQSSLKNLVLDSARERSRARIRMKSNRFPKYRGFLKTEREKAVREILALAQEHRAAIGIEDISGVDKSTWIGKVNLLRSHWDFGKYVDLLTYRSVLAGLPVVRRRRKKELFRFTSFRAMFTCSACGYTNAGKPENERLVVVKDGQIFCGNCQTKTDKDWNAARVVVAETRKFFMKVR